MIINDIRLYPLINKVNNFGISDKNRKFQCQNYKIMKRFCIAGLLVIFCFSFSKLFAQADLSQYYTFEKDSGAYKSLDTAKMVSVNQGDVWVEDTTFNIPTGFNFFFFDSRSLQIWQNCWIW